MVNCWKMCVCTPFYPPVPNPCLYISLRAFYYSRVILYLNNLCEGIGLENNIQQIWSKVIWILAEGKVGFSDETLGTMAYYNTACLRMPAALVASQKFYFAFAYAVLCECVSNSGPLWYSTEEIERYTYYFYYKFPTSASSFLFLGNNKEVGLEINNIYTRRVHFSAAMKIVQH